MYIWQFNISITLILYINYFFIHITDPVHLSMSQSPIRHAVGGLLEHAVGGLIGHAVGGLVALKCVQHKFECRLNQNP